MQKIDSLPALIYDICIKETWIVFCVFIPFAVTLTYYCMLALRITTQLNFGQLFIYLDRDADKYHLTQRSLVFLFLCSGFCFHWHPLLLTSDCQSRRVSSFILLTLPLHLLCVLLPFQFPFIQDSARHKPCFVSGYTIKVTGVLTAFTNVNMVLVAI